MAYKIREDIPGEKIAEYDTSPLLARLLYYRNITPSAYRQFLFPEYDRDSHDPFTLADADKAAMRIIQAIENKERMVVYADYDADGIPGATIFAQFLKKIGFDNYEIYIPHRHDEGFGLNVEAVNEFANKNTALIITIDCGITDIEAVKTANECGIDVIVTDHHEPPEILPPAFAIVDPKRKDCKYPDKNLCGSGVIYKLIQAILRKKDFGLVTGWEKWLLDLVAIATLSDMVPLVGENRVFAYYGLQVLRKTPRKGLRRLLEMLRVSQSGISEDDIAFMITPRINAASRMGVPMDAFNLLSADNDADAERAALHLDSINNERKAAVAVLVKEVKKTLKHRYELSLSDEEGTNTLPSVIVLGNPDWRPSLLGLVANTCAEEYNRPVFLWGRDGSNTVKGSCRSEGATHVVNLMRDVDVGVFTQFGGHKYSGGFTVNADHVHFLDRHLNDAFSRMVIGNDKGDVPSTAADIDWIDMELALDDVDWKLYDDVAQLAPFGTGNAKPIFAFKKVKPIAIRRFGKGNEHVGIDFAGQNRKKLSAISFFGAENKWAEELKVGKPLDLFASLEKSTFRNVKELRLRVYDIIPS